ncbi:MAG: amino acid ABC transporter substrate-binding protein [Pseudomonadota bacterium]
MQSGLVALAFVFLASTDVADGSPTLERIAETGVMRIGFVPDAPPLSFSHSDGSAAGYSIDLCQQIAESVRGTLALESLDIEFVPLVSMEDRISAVESGRVDIECGATTVTLSRRERVDFTLMTFITGSAIMSRSDAPIDTVEDAMGKTIAAIRGTTTEAVLRQMTEVNRINLTLALIETHDQGVELLNKNEVDGYASDRAMLIGQEFRAENARNRYTLSRGALSFEPYAMMVKRGDVEFRLVADRALAGVYRTAKIRRLHQLWFGQYGETITPIVEAMYQFQAVGE